MRLEFIVRTSNPSFLAGLDGKRGIGMVHILDDGLEAKLVSETEVSNGISKNEIAVGLLIGIASGVPAGIVANRIYDHLMDSGNNEIIIKEERISILTKDELVQYIEKTYSKKSD
ncbi:MAG: hypothetical protein ACI9SP_004770 [Arenicella sp.]|jgi:hypothetical protein